MTEFVQASVENHIGFITLNRPQALNALSPEMIAALTETLRQWREDPAVLAVFVCGAGEKGFCAGGDIRHFHEMAHAGDPGLLQFFAGEYRLNYLVENYPKPYIALMDGVVMGGGMGISQGVALRIVTDTTRMAMPETQIGLFPDVGGGYFLSHLPGRLGEYLGVTGVMLGAADALHAGLADVYLPRAAHGELRTLLLRGTWHDGTAVVEAIRALAARQLPPAASGTPLPALRDAVDRIFALQDVPAMLAALDEEADCAIGDWAERTAATMRKRSPLMMCVTLEQIRRGRTLTLADELRAELGMMKCVFDGGEAVEGIRALVIDKDQSPRWQPPSLTDVTPEHIAPFFISPWQPEQHPLADLGEQGKVVSANQ